jgi:hypothetical protein
MCGAYVFKAAQELKSANDDLVNRIGAGDDALNAAKDNTADLRASIEAYKEAHPWTGTSRQGDGVPKPSRDIRPR